MARIPETEMRGCAGRLRWENEGDESREGLNLVKGVRAVDTTGRVAGIMGVWEGDE